jgi:hypothetical protein
MNDVAKVDVNNPEANDSCISARIEGEVLDVIVHRNAVGIACFHSPLANGAIHCDICETPGTKVRLE